METLFIVLLVSTIVSAIFGLVMFASGFLLAAMFFIEGMFVCLVASVVIGIIGVYLAEGE